MNLSAKDLLKKYTSVPNSFVDELFTMYDETTGPYDFVINLDYVAKWLGIKKFNLNKTLREKFKSEVDYIIKKAINPNKKDNRNNNYKLVMVTPDCFKRLCMQSMSKKADDVRSYFIEVENVLFKYRNDLVNGLNARINQLEKNQKPKTKLANGFMYVFKASDTLDSVYKLGRAQTVKRLIDHNSSHADDLDIVWTYETEDLAAVEGCVKSLLRARQYRKYKEIYQADIDMIKETISDCSKLNLKLKYRNRKPTVQKGGFYIALVPIDLTTINQKLTRI